MIVYLARDIPAFVMYCVNGESVMIIDYHSNKSIIGIYNIIDYDNRLIVPALVKSYAFLRNCAQPHFLNRKFYHYSN